MDTPPPTIRTLQPADVDTCAAIYRDAYDCYPYGKGWEGVTGERIISEISRRWPEECFVAEVEGQVVGFIVCSSLAGMRATIEEFSVTPSRQGRGIGDALLKHVMNHYRERGVTFLELVANRRAPAYQFYQRRGFAETVEYRLMSLEL